MGKIKKIKAERKKQEVAHQIRKIKRRKLAIKSLSLVLIISVLGVGLYYGYQYSDSRWQVGQKVSGAFNDFKKNLASNNKKEAQPKKGGEPEAQERKMYTKAPEMQIDINKAYKANFETNKGDFSVELFTKDAPKTVNNFVVLSRDGFYNGLTFHRIIKDFMIQGGDPSGDGTGGPGYKFEDEFNNNKLVKGVLAMANSGPNTNGSQFFIVTAEKTEWLDGKHTAFGKVVQGLENVLKIENVSVGENDKPKEPVVVSKITIEEK